MPRQVASRSARTRTAEGPQAPRSGRTSFRNLPTAPRVATRSVDRSAVVAALSGAEQVTGVGSSVLHAIAARESQFNPTAKNPLSSARGLMQFTRSTWLEVVRDFGERHGLGGYAAALRTDRAGNITTRDPRVLTRILQMRDDPQLAAVMASERIGQQRAILERELGRPVKPADLYLVHMLGPQGARRFLAELRRNPAASSTTVVGAAARPNPGVFERHGRSLPLSQVYQEVAELMQPRATLDGRPDERKQVEAPPAVAVLASTAP
ncbi:transglycosylase SLT domain-containing protein [Muricoccus aerilatus]|uniref:transglycosylase SLT domain-containing protein n=1 Tax=Muricoccus aerilatus TaxID=452982 RepID=UPI0038CD2DF3